MSVYNSDDFLFYYSGAERRARVAAGDPSFSRSSTAMRRDRSEIMREVDEGAYRRNWVEDENGFRVPANRLEAERTNSITRSEDFSHSDWTASGLTVTTDNDTAPDGNDTADRLDGSSSSDDVDQTATVSDDSNDRAASVFVRKGESTQVRLEMGYTGGTTEVTEHIDLDTTDGSVTKSGGETRSGVEDWNANWYRLWLVVSNNGSGNTTLAFRLYPDQSGNNVSQHLWGAQLEGVSGGASFPSSYIATTDSAVSRAADELNFPISFGPQSLTMYVKVRVHGPFVEPRLVQLGASNGVGTYAFFIDGASGGVRVGVNDDAPTYFTLAGMDSPTAGDIVEVRGVMDVPNDKLIQEQAINGSQTNLDTGGSVGTLSSQFDESLLNMGSNAEGGGSFGQFCDFIYGPLVAPGVKTMDEMRNLAGTA